MYITVHCFGEKGNKKLSLLTPVGGSRILKGVKYLILINVHIFLGISFILKETPIIISVFVPFFSKNIGSIKNANSIVISYMIQTFTIGKPIDLVIYASLSQKVKAELQRMFCCKSRKQACENNNGNSYTTTAKIFTSEK